MIPILGTGMAFIFLAVAIYMGKGTEKASTPSPVNSPVECLNINLEDRNAIDLKYLALLQYVHKGERKQLRIIQTIAGSWKNLGVLFGYDVNQIAQNHVMGLGYVEDCCKEMLTLWLSKGAKDYPISWRGFITALYDIELNRVALDIEDALKCIVA